MVVLSSTSLRNNLETNPSRFKPQYAENTCGDSSPWRDCQHNVPGKLEPFWIHGARSPGPKYLTFHKWQFFVHLIFTNNQWNLRSRCSIPLLAVGGWYWCQRDFAKQKTRRYLKRVWFSEAEGLCKVGNKSSGCRKGSMRKHVLNWRGIGTGSLELPGFPELSPFFAPRCSRRDVFELHRRRLKAGDIPFPDVFPSLQSDVCFLAAFPD